MTKRAITLTEVLLVVVIIAILATILFPNFQSFRIRAQLKEIPINADIIKTAERLVRYKKGNYYLFNTSSVSLADLERNLNIVLDLGEDRLCRYGVTTEDAGATLVITAYAKNPENNDAYDRLCFYRFNPNTGLDECYKDMTHPYHPYVTWCTGEPYYGVPYS